MEGSGGGALRGNCSHPNLFTCYGNVAWLTIRQVVNIVMT